MKSIKYKCSVCGREINDKEFKLTNDSKKCILHCEKNDWFEIEDNLKNWAKSENEIKHFWKKIRNLILQVSNKENNILDFKNVIFPQFEYTHYLDYEVQSFNQQLGNKEFNFVKYQLEGLSSYGKQPEFIFNTSINFSNSIFLDDVNFNYYKFEKFICFNNVKFYGKCNFKNTEFNEVSFDKVNFFKEVIFENSILNFINYNSKKDFENTIFHDDIKFYTSKFSTVESNKAYDIKFMGTQFKRIYIMGCDFEKGICFFRDTKADNIAINSATINFLYIESDVPNIHISNNKKEINKLTIKHNTLKSLTIHNTIIKEDFIK
ncbi:pentapeptide repeat-containing protein [Aliarcobacter butzleri]|uniref:pentapeptide repeat-containing protein n=1 Tax=Aliarcobacter butzleri TaxID=28197 RepID=UPI0021B229F5|nr:pentapeptide repeat-containing protein [Aliarcobacter butzleri]MCT7583255.1 pentapeptide repeat-containing protein [Aliarcobacter butzleri]MCT7634024.1 pentapeptide repeat-containing protein [Aliarcobacter butzleri]